MRKILGYYYFRLFKYFSDGSAIPFFKAFSIIFIFAFLNFLTILSVGVGITNNKKVLLPGGAGLSKLWWLMIIVPLFILFNYYINKQGNHDKIMEEFKNETKRERMLSGVFLIVYFIASITLFILSL